MKNLEFFVPPCGVDCNKCPRYKKGNKPCDGFYEGCTKRKCKGIYVCCVEKKGISFCYECKSYPCSRYKKFADSWKKLGDDLLKNQKYIKDNGAEEFIKSRKI